MRKATLRQIIRYRFDNLMAKGPVALIFCLGLLTLMLIVAVSGLDLALDLTPADDKGQKPDLGTLLWMGLMRAMDAGTVGGDQGSWQFLLSMLAVTVGGIFIFSTLVGILSNGINEKLQDLRKGKSFVVEKGHTIILGWSDNVFTIISEICEANRSRGSSCIVILAQKDKGEMDEEISARITRPGKTRIVCRHGNPIDFVDLDIVSPQTSRSIIILSDGSESADAQVIKSMLAIVNNPRRRKEPYHIVAELKERESVNICQMVGKDEVKTVLSPEVIARIMVQTCRQPGLSVVYTELLDFGGDEVYLAEDVGLSGSSYGEALFRYPKACVMGIAKKSGKVLLNPPANEKIEKGDRVIAIAEDDDKVIAGPPGKIDTSALKQATASPKMPEKTLLLGWNNRANLMLTELDQYVAPGSSVIVVTDSASGQAEAARIGQTMKNQKLEVRAGHPNDRSLLDELLKVPYGHILTISNGSSENVQEADAQTLITLLHLRDISSKTKSELSIVSEMLDTRNRELAEVTGADDFIVSDRLISLMMSQISESRELSDVFEDLFQPDGSEIYLKPASDYIESGKPVNFYTIVEAARLRNETAIGYRLTAQERSAENGYGVRVNPNKSDMVTLGKDDRVIVLAES